MSVKLQLDLIDHTIQPVPTAVFSVAEGHGDPVLRMAGPHHRAQDALADHDLASHAEVPRGDHRVAAPEVARDRGLHVTRVHHQLILKHLTLRLMLNEKGN